MISRSKYTDTASLFDSDSEPLAVSPLAAAPPLPSPLAPSAGSAWRPQFYRCPLGSGITIREMVEEGIQFQCELCGDMFSLDPGWSMLDMGKKTGICQHCKRGAANR